MISSRQTIYQILSMTSSPKSVGTKLSNLFRLSENKTLSISLINFSGDMDTGAIDARGLRKDCGVSD